MAAELQSIAMPLQADLESAREQLAAAEREQAEIAAAVSKTGDVAALLAALERLGG